MSIFLLLICAACHPAVVTDTGSTKHGDTSDVDSSSTETGDTGDTDSSSMETGDTGDTDSSSTETGDTGDTDSSSTETGDTGDTDSSSMETGDTGSEIDLASCDDLGSDVVIEGLELTCADGVFTLYWDFSGPADFASVNVSTGAESWGLNLGDDADCCGSANFTSDDGCTDRAWGYVSILYDEGGFSCASAGTTSYDGCSYFETPVTCDDVP